MPLQVSQPGDRSPLLIVLAINASMWKYCHDCDILLILVLPNRLRKVRCDMANPCKTCTGRNLRCTFNEARKKRGPVPGRLARLQKHPLPTSPRESVLDFNDSAPTPLSNVTAVISPSSTHEGAALHRVSTISSDGHTITDANNSHTSPLTFWTQNQDTSQHPNGELVARHDLQSVAGVNSHTTAQEDLSAMSQHLDMPDFLLPSLPIDSPPDDSYNLFATIPEQDLPPIVESVEFWPRSISQEALLPWIDVYFKRLHPTVPVLNKTMVYQEMLLRKHHRDPQFGAMLLALCAFAMTQPVQIHEVASTPSRSVQARMLLEESIKMRMTVDFGEDPSVHMILASFFIFACLFGYGLHKAAHHRLREAVDLANSLSMHLPQAYDNLSTEKREQWLRTYLVLSVTER